MNNPFEILQNSDLPIEELKSHDFSSDVDERIKQIIGQGTVLFMKGNAPMPQCGFSANSVALLAHLQVPLKTYNILEDQELRQRLKEFSNWPTFPQLYHKGELIGGNDILTEMAQSGELQKALA